jgi:PAS domain S-box-containing protein
MPPHQDYSKLHSSMLKAFDALNISYSVIEIIFDKNNRPIDGVFKEICPSTARLIGKPTEQIIEKSLRDVFNKTIFEAYAANYKKVIKTGQPAHYQVYSSVLKRYLEIYIWKIAEAQVATVILDITESKAAEQALKQSEEKARQRAEELQKLMDMIPAVIWISNDPECRYITGNQTANSFYEVQNGENVSAGTSNGKNQDTTRRYFKNGKELSPGQLPMQEAVFGNKEIINSELEVYVPSGKKSTLLGSAKPLLGDDGKVRGCLGTFFDITERKRVEESLRESEERFRIMADGTPNMIWVTDQNGKNLFTNKYYHEFCNLSPEQVKGDKWHQLIHPEDLPLVLEKFKVSLQTHKELVVQARLKRRDGEWRWFEASAAPRFSSKGDFLGLVGISIDVTEHKEFESALKSSEIKFHSLFDNSFDAILLTEPDGNILSANVAACSMFGMTEEEMKNCGRKELLVPDDRAKEALERRRRDGKGTAELTLKRKDGTTFPAEVSSSLFTGEHGVIKSSMIIRDISERKRAEQELLRYAESLEQTQKELKDKATEVQEYALRMEELAEQRLKQLKEAERLATIGATAGMVGHDIRNPLQAIVGDLYLAKADLAELPEEKARSALEYILEIDRNIDYINKIVQDLQDYARPLNPKPENVDLKQLIEGLIAKNVVSPNIKVSINIGPGAGEIKTDGYYLNRIFYNLLTNSVQAMPQGGKLTIETLKTPKYILLTVTDTGVGIPKDVQAKMFTVMFTTKSKGQGFGLPVVKRMTESLGGSVSFESQAGNGTTFTLKLPIKA